MHFMKKSILSAFIIYLLGVTSCSVKHLSLDTMLAQNQFPITRIDGSTYSIQVNYYDTASYYDSPYQRFMQDNSNKPDGKLIVTDEHGIIRRTLFYQNHLRNGMDTWYYSNGDVMQEKKFVNSHYVSYRTFYPKRGILESALDDTLGYKKKWDAAGNLIYEKNYVTGEFKQWDNNGNLLIKGMECPGECYTMMGPWYYYSANDVLDKIVFYHGDTDPAAWDSIYHYRGNTISYRERKK
jgi:hypothetical protein